MPIGLSAAIIPQTHPFDSTKTLISEYTRLVEMFRLWAALIIAFVLAADADLILGEVGRLS
jgi:hypothetical protein